MGNRQIVISGVNGKRLDRGNGEDDFMTAASFS